jgi:hypothetical protein
LKKYLWILVLPIALWAANVASPVLPSSESDVYPTVYTRHIAGGWHEVADLTARDAISADRRVVGMIAYDTTGHNYYQLIGGLSNSNWVKWNTKPIQRFQPARVVFIGSDSLFTTDSTVKAGPGYINIQRPDGAASMTVRSLYASYGGALNAGNDSSGLFSVYNTGSGYASATVKRDGANIPKVGLLSSNAFNNGMYFDQLGSGKYIALGTNNSTRLLITDNTITFLDSVFSNGAIRALNFYGALRGTADVATYALTAGEAHTVDGQHASYIDTVNHGNTVKYVPGNSMTVGYLTKWVGNYLIADSKIKDSSWSSINLLRFGANAGTDTAYFFGSVKAPRFWGDLHGTSDNALTLENHSASYFAPAAHGVSVGRIPFSLTSTSFGNGPYWDSVNKYLGVNTGAAYNLAVGGTSRIAPNPVYNTGAFDIATSGNNSILQQWNSSGVLTNFLTTHGYSYLGDSGVSIGGTTHSSYLNNGQGPYYQRLTLIGNGSIDPLCLTSTYGNDVVLGLCPMNSNNRPIRVAGLVAHLTDGTLGSEAGELQFFTKNTTGYWTQRAVLRKDGEFDVMGTIQSTTDTASIGRFGSLYVSNTGDVIEIKPYAEAGPVSAIDVSTGLLKIRSPSGRYSEFLDGEIQVNYATGKNINVGDNGLAGIGIFSPDTDITITPKDGGTVIVGNEGKVSFLGRINQNFEQHDYRGLPIDTVNARLENIDVDALTASKILVDHTGNGQSVGLVNGVTGDIVEIYNAGSQILSVEGVGIFTQSVAKFVKNGSSWIYWKYQ